MKNIIKYRSLFNYEDDGVKTYADLSGVWFWYLNVEGIDVKISWINGQLSFESSTTDDVQNIVSAEKFEQAFPTVNGKYPTVTIFGKVFGGEFPSNIKTTSSGFYVSDVIIDETHYPIYEANIIGPVCEKLGLELLPFIGSTDFDSTSIPPFAKVESFVRKNESSNSDLTVNNLIGRSPSDPLLGITVDYSQLLKHPEEMSVEELIYHITKNDEKNSLSISSKGDNWVVDYNTHQCSRKRLQEALVEIYLECVTV